MSENQENVGTPPPKPKRHSLNVAEQGIDGLSLNSPRPRSPLVTLNNFSLNELLNKPILNPGFSPIHEESETEGCSTPKRILSRLNEGFKRPSPPIDDSLHLHKRARSVFTTSCVSKLTLDNGSTEELKTCVLTRAVSESAMTIKTAVERINSDPNLLGDGSKGHILPIMLGGKHRDLKEITSSSLVALTEGEYNKDVISYEIIDCRYPYEFEGGHIQGAINLHTKRQIYDRFFGTKEPCKEVNDGKRHIVVFHCEFSSQRGPDMCRYVRDCDRKMNDYPFLHYPELYVLFGGYKAFFEQYQAYCTPQKYLTMVDEKYTELCRFYKNLSKTDIVSSSNKSNKKSFSKSQGKVVKSASMKKLYLDHL